MTWTEHDDSADRPILPVRVSGQDVDYPGRTTCPVCGLAVPSGPRFAAWCEGCGWNALPPPQAPRRALGALHRWRRSMAQREAARAHEDPIDAGRDATVTGLNLALCVVVLAGFLALAAGVLWWTIRGSGFWHWPGAALGALVIAFLVLGLRTPDDGALVLEPDEAAGLYTLVGSIADIVGAPAPARIRVDASDNAAVRLRPLRRRPELTIGLVLWTRLPWDQRVALLGHELGHLAGRHLSSLVVTSTAQNLLAGTVRLLWPAAYDLAGMNDLVIARGAWGPVAPGRLSEWLGAAVQRAVALPALGTLALMGYLDAASRQRREYAADRAAARLAGSDAAYKLLVSSLAKRGWTTSVAAAVRRGVGPWEALSGLDVLPDREVERLRRIDAGSPVQPSSSHPPTHLRMAVLRGRPWTGASYRVDPTAAAAVDAELTRARRLFHDEVEDHFLHS